MDISPRLTKPLKTIQFTFDCEKKGAHFQQAEPLISLVGMTRLERATTRPPDVYSTN